MANYITVIRLGYFLNQIKIVGGCHAIAANGKVLCDVAVSRHFTFNLQLMFNKGTNAEFCTSPAIAQNTVTCRIS
jgi:hypothetical protein